MKSVLQQPGKRYYPQQRYQNSNRNRKYHDRVNDSSPHHFSTYSKHYLSNVWIRIVKFSFAFNVVSSFGVKLHVPNRDYVGSMMLKLPMVCKYTVLQAIHLVYENLVWLAELSTFSTKQNIS